MPNYKAYPTNISDEEWVFVAPYLTLMDEAAPQRQYELRWVFDALRWHIRAGSGWRLLPGDFPPWAVVYQQAQRWIGQGVFEAMVHDLRGLLRMADGRSPDPTAVVLDSRTVKSTDSSEGAGYDGGKRVRGRKVHAAVDTLGNLLALHITPANEQDRAQVGELLRRVQEVTGESTEKAYVDMGYTGDAANEAALCEGVQLSVVKRPGAKGFILLPRRWVVERSFAWINKFRRLARDYERLPETVKGLTFLAFACVLLGRTARMFG
jgi:transposase